MSCPKIENNQISCLVITYNEEKNIRNLLNSIAWSPQILILDSGSTDKTLNILSEYSNVRILFRKFDTFANQCNYGLSHLTSDWVLSLDADYVVTKELKDEIISVLSEDIGRNKVNYSAFQISFKYCINNQPIRSGMLPARTCFYRREHASYLDVGHAHKVSIIGCVGSLKGFMLHNDRKSLWTWLGTQRKYQFIESHMLKNTNSRSLPIQDKLRKHTFLAPFIAFVVCLVFRGGIFDGKPGLIYAYQRLVAESLLFLAMHSDEAEMED